MELDDFQNTWEEMSTQLKTNQQLNPKMIDNMSKKKFGSSLNKIKIPEVLGSAICLGCAVFIVFNFNTLNSLAYQIAGVLAILLFILLPAISLRSIQLLHRSADVTKPYSENLKEFAIQKINFCRLQKLNFTLSHLLLVCVILLITRLFGHKAITDNNYFFITSFGFGYIVLVFFSKWVLKSYNKTIRRSEELLSELAN